MIWAIDWVLPLKDNVQLLTGLPVRELLNIMTVSQKRKRMPPCMWACGNRLTGCIPYPTWSLYQSMSWMRSHPAFFVRCAEVVPSPCCGEALSVIGSRKRKLVDEGGDCRLLVIRRLRCKGCRKIH
ncbi:DUF6431 domain-containing protein, partial [Paenibacillus doosanensis]|uniref:DUF6431 domain-containing protein n=1 Tax=Paenibacillus doosanensis TaxID=1229154 RepID=UPI0035C7F5AA